MKKYTLFVIYLFLMLFSIKLLAVPPVLNKVLIADVTDRSFSLIYTSSEVAGTPKIEIYSDSDGINPLSDFELNAYPVNSGAGNRSVSRKSIIDSAKALGIVKLNISGLKSDTQYYIKYGFDNTATTESTLCPDAGSVFCTDPVQSLIEVITARELTRNQQLSGVDTLHTNDISLLIKPDVVIGELVIMATENTQYPISVFAGDGASLPYVFIDMNNVIAPDLRSTYIVHGFDKQVQGNYGESIVIRKYSGLSPDTMQRGLIGKVTNSASPVNIIDRDMADCNADGRVNGYDSLILQHVINQNTLSGDYLKVAFHPFLCNLFSEEGLNNVSKSATIDSSDFNSLSDILVGKKQRENFPESP